MPQVSPLMAPPQQYNPQIPPPYFHHYTPTNSPSGDSKEKKEKSAKRNVRNVKREKQTRGSASTRLLKR